MSASFKLDAIDIKKVAHILLDETRSSLYIDSRYCLKCGSYCNLASRSEADKKAWIHLKRSFLCIIVILLTTLAIEIESADSHYEACMPRSCGNGPNISYPFWIFQEQQSFCGYPNLEITCKEENPILKISEGSYIIKDIFYNNNSFLVVNSVVYEDDCPIPLQNVSLDRTPFSLTLDNVNLSFLYNCEEQPEYHTYPVSCASNTSSHSFAVFHKEALENTNYSVESCHAFVDAPVYIKDDVGFVSLLEMNYTEVLRVGFILNWTAHSCSNCKRSGGRCGFDNTNDIVCFCSDGSHPKTCNDGKSGRSDKNLGTKLAIGFGATTIILLITCIITLCFRRKISCIRTTGFLWKFSKSDPDIEAFIRNNGTLAPKRYSYSDVRKMTNSFKEKLGKGGYGSVYKGKLLDGHFAAVKVLNTSKGNGQEFINEVASISRTSHVNVVTLLGFCLEGRKRALIYEFMPNGSLERFIYKANTLKDRQHLSAEELYKIAIRIARGLEYLHCGCSTRILHFDIKPHNILLDENFSPKISDFGLAKLCTREESIVSMLEARGTIGYIAPEVFCRSVGGVSHKSDVYSYGMMILEMVGGRRNLDVGVSQTSEVYFPHWIYRQVEQSNIELKLLGLMTREETEIARKMIVVGLWCIQTNPIDRPSMSKVIEMLEGSIEVLQFPPKPYMSSPPRSPLEDSTSSLS
ncbi:hypothetical protein REPUB_Repub07fG0104700 [Reevesia pubescens]